jgi:hypothetical protein
MKKIFLFLTLLLSLSAFSQKLAVYTDYLGKVQLFDGGRFEEIEHMPLTTFKIGNSSIAYEDNSSNFKIYYNHYAFSIADFVTKYYVTDNLIAYNLNSQLKVFDNGDNKTLSVQADENYKVGDDLVAFYDKLSKIFSVYYNGEIIPLDDALASDEITQFDVGENTLVYKDAHGYLHIFYQGEVYELLFAERAKSYSLGRDVVAFVETPINNFQVFMRGEFYELESFEPRSYKVGDGFVAYIDFNDYLKVFNGEETVTVSFDASEIDSFDTSDTVSFDESNIAYVEDELLIYSVQNYFKVYWKGNTYTLENYIPESYEYDFNMIAYIDEHGYLKVFDRGVQKILSYEEIKDFGCHGNVVYYSFGVKSNGIYWNGKIYSGD